jgi:hypothetical protein
VIWDFLQRYDESWIWRCADRHEVTESSRNFAARDECVADAARHGYITPDAKISRAAATSSEVERRRRRKSERSARVR